MIALPVINLHEATFECTYGRGCSGVCCTNGRPAFQPTERERVEQTQQRWLPMLRPAAKTVVERLGYESRRLRRGLPMLRVVDGWCVFFNEGCVLHRLGAQDGDWTTYKPICCTLFPLIQGKDRQWFVRQRGYRKERWALPCLDSESSSMPAAASLADEIALAARLVADDDPRVREP